MRIATHDLRHRRWVLRPLTTVSVRAHYCSLAHIAILLIFARKCASMGLSASDAMPSATPRCTRP